MNVIDWMAENLGLTQAELAQARALAVTDGAHPEFILGRMGLLNEDNAALLYTGYYGIEPAENLLPELSDIQVVSEQLNTEFLESRQWLPIANQNDEILFVSPWPLDRDVLQYLSVAGVKYRCQFLGETPFRALSLSLKHEGMRDGVEVLDSEQALALAQEAPTVNLVNSLITRSVRMRASDLHIEPYCGGYRARVRIDGIMSVLDSLPPKLQLAVISRIKILSGMDISERRRPQDGKIEMEMPGMSLDIRVSSLPLAEGESIVMRFLFQENVSYELSSVGLSQNIQNILLNDLQKTAGLILMTGPTGSGKTTTLYALLNQLNDTEKKIITLEDPVEYSMNGVNQVQVRPEIGFDFASGLRSIVRQDPDVIMVGEIRDVETAKIALQSAITGHLVFSTVHTNDAPSAYTRLRELGVEDHLINAGLISIIAQRLVRKLCPECKIQVKEIPELLEEPIEKRRQSGEHWQIYKQNGCDHCNHTGYRGRLPIIQYMPCDDDILALEKDAGFVRRATKRLIERGYATLYQDGVDKVLNGETTLAEVIRVAG